MRGDVVIVDFPFAEGGGSKVRPALVVQVDGLRTLNLILAMITSVVSRGGPSRALIDPSDPSESRSGLRMPSLVLCDQLFSIRRDRILRIIGHVSPMSMGRVENSLRIALGLDGNPT